MRLGAPTTDDYGRAGLQQSPCGDIITPVPRTTLHEQVRALVESFVADLLPLIRAAGIEAVQEPIGTTPFRERPNRRSAQLVNEPAGACADAADVAGRAPLSGLKNTFLSPLDFTEAVFSRFEEIAESNNGARRIRLRSDVEAKRIIEELLPLSVFARQMMTPERRVKILHTGNTRNYDAELHISGTEVSNGTLAPSYFVEVATVLPDHDYLVREKLEKDGAVFLGGDIRRIGSKRKGDSRISNRPIARFQSEYAEDLTPHAIRVFQAKAEKEYPSPCILVLNLMPELRLPPSSLLGILLPLESVNHQFSQVWAVSPFNDFCTRLS